MMFRRSRLPSAAFLLLALSAPVAWAQPVGNIGAVNPDATGAPPGASARKLTLGAGVVQSERLQTDAQGSAQVVFTDRSSLSIGRNSTVTIDRFVYDPSSGAGEMTTNMTRGALRFVGGQVSHTRGATIKTPAATIGVRGGVATLAYDSRGVLRVINNFGVVTVENGAGRQVIQRPGFEVLVQGAGFAPGEPHRVDPAALAAITAQLTSSAGQRGGARIAPTDSASRKGGVGSPRPDVDTPTFDLPAAAEDFVRGQTGTRNQRLTPVVREPGVIR